MGISSPATLLPAPSIDIGAEVAVVRRENPRLAVALETIADHLSAQAAWIQAIVDEPWSDFKVEGPDGQLDGRIGNWKNFRGAWFRNLLVGPSETAPLITAINGVVAIDGSVIVGAPPSSLNVDFPFVSGLTLQNNTPAAGRITWSAFTLIYRGVSHSVVTGNTATSALTHVYWDLASPTVLTAVAGASFTPANNRFVLLVNDGGTALNTYQGPTKNSTLGIFIPDGAIVAAKIAAAAIEATKLSIKKIIIAGMTVTNNSPSAGRIAWSAFSLYYNGTAYSISSGDTALMHAYWTVGNTSLTAANSFTPGPTIFEILTNSAGVHDEVWDKLGNTQLQRTHLSFPLLEGFQLQPISTTAIDLNTVANTTIINESLEGVLLGVSVRINDPALDTCTVSLEFTMDGATMQSISVYSAGTVFSIPTRTSSQNTVGNGTTIGDFFSFLIGISYRISLLLKCNVSEASAGSGNISVYVHRAHKV